MKQKFSIAALVTCLVLQGCGGTDELPEEPHNPSGAKSAVYNMHSIAQKLVDTDRPSAALGVFASIFTSQGVILPVTTASDGINAAKGILSGQSNSNTSENFALLREVGDVLQVNIVDSLNRSSDRPALLNDYIQSLNTTGVLIERKIVELEELQGTQKDKQSDSRDVVRKVEKKLKTAMKVQDYSQASVHEEELAGARADYAEISTKVEQTKDMLKRFDTLLTITSDRYQAISNNREILIAGLRVIRIPGIADLNILEEGKSWRKRRGVQLFSN